MVVLLLGLFLMFGLFCMGRVLSWMILPVTIVATLFYVLYATGVFSSSGNGRKPHQQLSQSTTAQATR